MKQRATQMGWIGRLVDIGEEFDHPTKMNWAESLEPEPVPEPVKPEPKPDPVAPKK